MDITQIAKEFLQAEFGQQLNAEGYCAFEYADTPILVQVNPQAECMVLYARMGQLPTANPETLALRLLGENLGMIYGHGIHFSCDLKQNLVLLCMHISATAAVPQYLSPALRAFAVSAKYYREQVQRMLQKPAPAATVVPTAAAPTGMVQV